MDNLKEKEQKLLESLVRLDTITDLVVGSKKKIVDLQEVKAKLETEKNDLSVKLSTLENENDGLKAELQELESSINSPDSLNENLKEKILTTLITGAGMVLTFVGVLRAKIIKFQLYFSTDLVLVENIGETI